MNVEMNVISRKTNIVRTIIFSLVLIAGVLWMGYFFQPTFSLENNYIGKKAFNKEPKNTVEVALIGSSVLYHGVSSMEMYEDRGISSWNLGSSAQPVSSSYYILQEAYRMHPYTLNTVVFEVFELQESTNESLRRSITDATYYYDIKFRANREYTDDVKEALSYTIPLVSYHTRWSEVKKGDFDKLETRPYLRGYFFDTEREIFNEGTTENLILSKYQRTADDITEAVLDANGLYYLEKIIDFCREKDIRLVLLKTPMADSWDRSEYNAVKSIANHYGLEYYDFNDESLYDSISFNSATDLYDGDHMNYWGARKLTKWLGDYLAEECGTTDVRGMAGYEFLEENLAEYQDKIEDLVELKSMDDPADYLSFAMTKPDYSIFITVRDDAASALTDEQRERFKSCGLPGLSAIGFRDSYLAVIEPGKGYIYEDSKKNMGEQEEPEDPDNLIVMETVTLEDLREETKAEKDLENEELSLTYEGNLPDNGYYRLESGGTSNISHCEINGQDESRKSRGINIVIYDNKIHEVVDSAAFDTCAYTCRVGEDLESELEKALSGGTDAADLTDDLLKLYQFNERSKEARSQMTETEGEGG